MKLDIIRKRRINIADMEELFLKALLWIDNIAPQDDYLDLLHEIYLQPENKDNQDFLELEDCTNNKAETYHVFLRIIHSEQSTWNEDLFNKLVTEYLLRRYNENKSVKDTTKVGLILWSNLPIPYEKRYLSNLSLLNNAEEYMDEPSYLSYFAYKDFFDCIYYYSDETEKEAALNKALKDDHITDT